MKKEDYHYVVVYNRSEAVLFRLESLKSLGEFVRTKADNKTVSIVQPSDDVVELAYVRAETRGLKWESGIDLTAEEGLRAGAS